MSRQAPSAARQRRTAVGSPRNPAVEAQLRRARDGLLLASTATSASERFVAAHLSALRAASAVLAARARPADPTTRRQPPRSVWALLPVVAPELVEWAAFFAAGAGRRAAAEAGIPGAVTARDADDLLRDADTFLALVETTLGLPRQETIPTGHVPLAPAHLALRAG